MHEHNNCTHLQIHVPHSLKLPIIPCTHIHTHPLIGLCEHLLVCLGSSPSVGQLFGHPRQELGLLRQFGLALPHLDLQCPHCAEQVLVLLSEARVVQSQLCSGSQSLNTCYSYTHYTCSSIHIHTIHVTQYIILYITAQYMLLTYTIHVAHIHYSSIHATHIHYSSIHATHIHYSSIHATATCSISFIPRPRPPIEGNWVLVALYNFQGFCNCLPSVALQINIFMLCAFISY